MASHQWSFSRIGGFDQALVTSGEDLKHLSTLDPKLWAALSCPVKGMHFDTRTLELIDCDKDGRVRVPEILSAVDWALSAVKQPDMLLDGCDNIAVSHFSETALGQLLAQSARVLLQLQQKSEQEPLTLDDIALQQASLFKAPLNGDGIITAAASPSLAFAIDMITRAYPGVLDAAATPGVTQALATQFFAACQARRDWLNTKPALGALDASACADGYAALDAVCAKLDDYFARCLSLQFDPAASAALNPHETAWKQLADTLMTLDSDALKALPIARATHCDGVPAFSLLGPHNPAWAQAVQTFYCKTLVPVLGQIEQMTFDQWCELKRAWGDYRLWRAAEVAPELGFIAADDLDVFCQGAIADDIQALIAEDTALMPQVQAFADLEKLIRLRMHLKELLNNFVNFTAFFSTKERAVFEAGTLYLDGRACELCIEVHDMAKHATLAGLSKCFLAYCDCTRPDGQKKSIVAAFTGGEPDYLLVGRNGVFFDRAGKDWDATIVKLIENPISIRQAFFAPYKRIIRFVEEQAAKSAGAAESVSQTQLQTAVVDASAVKAPPKPKFDLSIIAALGVAVGGVTTAIGMLLQAFFGLGWLMPLGLLGLLVFISGPSIFIAWLKLRQRNLGPILDATGWAINGQIKINVPFGGKLTQLPKLPAGSQRNLADPYAEDKPQWPKWLLACLGVAVVALGLTYYKGWCPLLEKPAIALESTPAAVVSEPAAPAAQ